MKVMQKSCKIVKPDFGGNSRPSFTDYVPLSVFDKVTYNTHIAVIYAYRPPTPPNSVIESGLRKALLEYREWAGRLVVHNDVNDHVILLNDKGVKFIEASVECTLDQAMPFKPSSDLLNLHPTLEGVEELMQVQLTRFTCGSLVVGFTSNHIVADGHATSNFLVAWGQACRGIDIKPCPLRDRTIFTPRDPPQYDHENRGVEFRIKKSSNKLSGTFLDHENIFVHQDEFTHNIIVQKVHFTVDFLSKLKDKASSALLKNNEKPYSTFVSLVAHLWRAVTKARGLNGFETTNIRLAVNGRGRLIPRIANEYFGNLVLWAYPTGRVKELLREPLPLAAKTINDAIAKVSDKYFKSFIDFTSYKAKEEELIPTADMNKTVLSPNLEVDSWLRFPFYDLDFGGGSPYIFMPSYFPTEGMIFLLPSFTGDGSIDAFIPLFQKNLASFKQICFSLE